MSEESSIYPLLPNKFTLYFAYTEIQGEEKKFKFPPICSIETILDFWNIFQQEICQAVLYSDFSNSGICLFKNKIQPKYEAEQNQGGSRIRLSFKTPVQKDQYQDNIILDAFLLAISGQLDKFVEDEHFPVFNGIYTYFSKQKNKDTHIIEPRSKIEFWFARKNDTQNDLSEVLITFIKNGLHVPETIVTTEVLNMAI